MTDLVLLSENFSLNELCKSNTAMKYGIKNTPNETEINNLMALCKNILESVRSYYGIAFRPNSGYRNSLLNKIIGGSETSQHCKGQAVDFELPLVDNMELYKWIKQNLEFDQLILEYYVPGVPNSGWVHCSYNQKNQRRKAMEIKNVSERVS